MTITVFIKEGASTSPFATTASTIGELFGNPDFAEDFSVPSGADPTIDGVRVSATTPITNATEIGWDRPVADKGTI